METPCQGCALNIKLINRWIGSPSDRPINPSFSQYLCQSLGTVFVTAINHFGFMRPKSVLACRLSDAAESRTTALPCSRTKTTQCQQVRPRSRCHLMASNARAGNADQDSKG